MCHYKTPLVPKSLLYKNVTFGPWKHICNASFLSQTGCRTDHLSGGPHQHVAWTVHPSNLNRNRQNPAEDPPELAFLKTADLLSLLTLFRSLSIRP